MKNFVTAIASALLVAVIVTSLYTLVFASAEPSPLSLFVLSFLGMAGVALFNIRQAALRSGLTAVSAVAAAHGAGAAGAAKPVQNRESSGRGGRNRNDRNRKGNDRPGKGERKDRPTQQKAPQDNARDSADKAPVQPAVIPDGPRETGTVKWFNRSKGFGFIIRDNGEEIFVHHRSIRNSDDSRRSNLRDGQTVNYVVADHTKGQQAEDVVGE